MRARTGSFSKLRASIRRSSAKLVQKLKGSPDGPNDAGMTGLIVTVIFIFGLSNFDIMLIIDCNSLFADVCVHPHKRDHLLPTSLNVNRMFL